MPLLQHDTIRLLNSEGLGIGSALQKGGGLDQLHLPCFCSKQSQLSQILVHSSHCSGWKQQMISEIRMKMAHQNHACKLPFCIVEWCGCRLPGESLRSRSDYTVPRLEVRGVGSHPSGPPAPGVLGSPSSTTKQAQGLCRPERSLCRRQPQPHRAPCTGPWVRSCESSKMRSSRIERMREKCFSAGATGKQSDGVKPLKCG